MVARGFAEDDGSSLHDNIVCLHDVSWADYERLLEIRGDHSAPRMAYLEGELEFMSPSKSHESIKSTLGRLVEVWCQVNGIEFSAVGSWTLKHEPSQRGVEPDECYVFGDAASVAETARPHLAIEIEWTAAALDKLCIYETLCIGELWVWSRGRLQVYELREAGGANAYSPISQSRALPGLDLRLLERLIEVPTTSQAIREFREAIAPV
ncbi:MAG TPA: Uma2 family endonuclease [Polyangiaceae bacterium]